MLMRNLNKFAKKIKSSKPPDFIIGDKDDPYLLRWWVIPRNRFFNIYIHEFRKSDNDEALHDHSWINFSYLIDGSYTEHTIKAGGINVKDLRKAGDFKLRLSGKTAHRIELTHGYCTTLFVTGPKYREWGFHCPKKGWVHWEKFCGDQDKGQVGRGCDE
jgi:hypothetical protein